MEKHGAAIKFFFVLIISRILNIPISEKKYKIFLKKGLCTEKKAATKKVALGPWTKQGLPHIKENKK